MTALENFSQAITAPDSRSDTVPKARVFESEDADSAARRMASRNCESVPGCFSRLPARE